MQTTITPRYVDAPKPGKKNWNVKDESGVSYSVPPEFAPAFGVGRVVTVDYSVSNYKGKDFNMVQGAFAASPAPQPAPQPLPPAPVPGSQYQRPPASVPRQNGHNATDAATAERIFVCGVVNACIKREGLNDLAQLVHIIGIAREAYRSTFGATSPDPYLSGHLGDHSA